MKYVDIDPIAGSVTWDRYFEYLRQAERQFPEALHRYALDWDHYSLDGANSLHDAWLVGIQWSYRGLQQVTLEFLGARHDRRHVLRYDGVKFYSLDLTVEYQHGDRDVMAHEFRIEQGGITHEVLFANNKRILVTADAIHPQVVRQV
jgi:hypothetical protein